MPASVDGPVSSLFTALSLNVASDHLLHESSADITNAMRSALQHAPGGACVGWGIPLDAHKRILISSTPVDITFAPVEARWLVFMHTSDVQELEYDSHGFPTTNSGYGRLGERAAEYIVLYADGAEERLSIRRRYQIGDFHRFWGENCFEAVAHIKPHPVQPPHEQGKGEWGWSQTRATAADLHPWGSWLWAWENPQPKKKIIGVRCVPGHGAVVLSAISAGNVSENPLRWHTREKAILHLPRNESFQERLDEFGLLAQITLDLGQVISATKRRLYPNDQWETTPDNCPPVVSEEELLVEYTAHPEASFHLPDCNPIPVKELANHKSACLVSVKPATQRVALRVIEQSSGKPVPVKLHIHGEAGEYLAPVDRHRHLNPAWFEDYSVDFMHLGSHYCTYISGETQVDVPLGTVFIEVAKGFEIRPMRLRYQVTRATEEIVITLEKVLPWRERGWVSADTHVHFLSTTSALLEGEAEGVNVVNLLTTQLGELMANVQDFDGKTTWGSREAGGSGEYLVRVGTENRQHILGHISLLGYEGPIIAPMTTGGPDESALGDPVECLMTEWALQCKRQNGLVVIPHFPNPRAETAATIFTGAADAVEMGNWGYLYSGISPYSLLDWYRYLNNGCLTAVVGGTDKMSTTNPVGAIRTYARLQNDEEFTYEVWKKAVRDARTFVTCGPLLEFSVEGKELGRRISLKSGGGKLSVEWQVASVTMPMSQVELVVNGEIRESRKVHPEADRGTWDIPVDRSSWLALLVRGYDPWKNEIIAAHSSPVMVDVAGSAFYAAADALSILEQIEGSLAYLDSLGTRTDQKAYQRMRLLLTSAHRDLHNRMHQHGQYHTHTPKDDHTEHHE